MTFTQDEEAIMKLVSAELEARMILNKANKVMGDEIRAEFKSIDERIRKEHEPVITPLQADLLQKQADLKARFE